MSLTSRERVQQTLRFESPDRLPRHIWMLPWAQTRFSEELKTIQNRWPDDIATPCAKAYRPSSVARGDKFTEGTYIDEWGCVFQNIQAGVIGEVRDPILKEIEDWASVTPPYETLPEDESAARDAVNRICDGSDHFLLPDVFARPWERYQFLRGTENAMMDVMCPDEGARDLIRVIHNYYCKELEFWASTNVDALYFMDDWGSQAQLLIPPPVWRELFKPLYKDYCDIAHDAGKFAFMHSDGCIMEIYDDLVDVGVDALNSQLFCMDLDVIAAKAKGKMTFWGEIDRQHVLPSPDPQTGRDAVRKVAQSLYDPAGGMIVQFEIGPGANPAVATAILEEWDAVQADAK